MPTHLKHLKHFRFPDPLEGFDFDNHLKLNLRSRPPRFIVHTILHTEDKEELFETKKLVIPYKPVQSLAVARSKEKIKDFFKFIFVSAFIFTVVFFTMNYHSYHEIFAFVLDPYSQKIKEDVLEKVVGSKTKTQKLLPDLPKDKLVRKTLPLLSLGISPPDNRIIIPKIGRNAPIVEMDPKEVKAENWASFEGAIQKGLKKGVVHYPGTAYPGQYGNVFITGHSSYYPWDKGKFKDVFALLPKMNVGDSFYVYYNQKKYTYKIVEKKEVKPTEVGVLDQPKNKRIVTLMTCVPVGTTLRRLILTAEQV